MELALLEEKVWRSDTKYGIMIEIKDKIIGPEEIPILVWGRRKRPQTKMGST